jgi:hypothetical protein
VLVVWLAWPEPFSATAIPAPPSTLKVIVPVGIPLPLAGATVAVKVTLVPIATWFPLEVSEVVVVMLVLFELRRNLETYALSFAGLEV